MATSLSPSEVECTCPVCSDIFTDPVVLLCGHSFCKDCLQDWWRQSSTQTCPVCKEMFKMCQPPRNLALRNLSDNLRQEKSERASTGAGGEDLCSLHSERFKLFCVDDQQPICVVCRDSKQHKTHNCEPLSEAAEAHKVKLRTAQMHLRTKEATFKRVKGECDKIASHIKLQAQQTENTIKEDYQKMYRFLRAEEASKIDALRTDERQESQKIKIQIDNLNSEISSISNTLKIIDDQLIAGDGAYMLNFKTTIKRAQDQAMLPDPHIPTGTLIDEAKNQGNVLFKVWNKMKGIIQYSCAQRSRTAAMCLGVLCFLLLAVIIGLHVHFISMVCDGWTLFGYKWYFISAETEVNRLKSWEDSRRHCQSQGAHLVSITSREENDFLRTNQIQKAWIGLSDQASEGTWRWVDGTTLQGEGFWMTGEPNDSGNEDCVELIDGTWNDLPCSRKRNWICEM